MYPDIFLLHCVVRGGQKAKALEGCLRVGTPRSDKRRVSPTVASYMTSAQVGSQFSPDIVGLSELRLVLRLLVNRHKATSKHSEIRPCDAQPISRKRESSVSNRQQNPQNVS